MSRTSIMPFKGEARRRESPSTTSPRSQSNPPLPSSQQHRQSHYASPHHHPAFMRMARVDDGHPSPPPLQYPASYPFSSYHHLQMQYAMNQMPIRHLSQSCLPLSFFSPHHSTHSSIQSSSLQNSQELPGNPRWANLPRPVLETIFTYLNLTDLRNCQLTCQRWNRVLADECCEVWRNLCLKQLSKSVLKSDILSSLTTFKEKLRAYHYSWDSNECSRNIYIKSNGFTLHRNPVAQSTDAARGKIGLVRGRHSWEIWWEGPLGTVAVVGVATRDAPLQATGYVALLGSNCETWGWNLVDNHLLHDGECLGSYPLQNNAPKYQTGERLRVILDCESRTLSFERGYEFLGVAFRGLPKKPLYPAVSAVYGNTEVSMVYLGYPLDG